MPVSSIQSKAISYWNADGVSTSCAELSKGGEFMKLIIEPIKIAPERPHYIICMDIMRP